MGTATSTITPTTTSLTPPSVDARTALPIIPRNQTNLWTRAEQLRDTLYAQLSEACNEVELRPLLLSSGPAVFPAWVKFEAWQPCGRATTARSTMTITVDPKPYHEHEFELEVTYTARNRTRTLRRVEPLTDREVISFIEHLARGGRKPTFRRFRELPFQLWREKNKIAGLAKDYLSIFMGVAFALGFMVLTLLPLALVLWAVAVVLLVKIRRRPWLVRNQGKPEVEPRSLLRVDSWQAVLFDLAGDADEVRKRLTLALTADLGANCRFAPERVWYWGLDGKVEREQMVITSGRGIVFCQIHPYGKDLYVGWDGHLNVGQWVEQTVLSGIDDDTRNPINLSRVVPGIQSTSEYDLADLSCLMEWTHAQIVKLVKQLIAEKQIDQEIDFKVQRAERDRVVSNASAASDQGIGGKVRAMFHRTT